MEHGPRSKFEAKLLELTRRGDIEKMKWMKNINRIILPNHLKRIQQNDKSVLQELVLPKWVSWDLLYEWADGKKHKAEGERACILCTNYNKVGIDFEEKFICENCFLKLKNLE